MMSNLGSVLAGDDAFEEIDSSRWLGLDDTDLSRRAASAFAGCAARLRASVWRRRRIIVDASRRRFDGCYEGKRKTRDVRAVLGCSKPIEGRGRCLRSATVSGAGSVVAPREDAAIELKAHDDPREVEAQIREPRPRTTLSSRKA